VAAANDTHETVVAGPYPRSVWDDHFLANWSPDAKSVIFMADLGDGQAIWQVNRDGTGMHKVFTPPLDKNPAPPFSGRGNGLDDGPAFTPDGSRIVFTRCCPVNSGYGLWSIKSDGTGLRLVTTETVGPAVDGPSDNLPQVSPDGRTIAFHLNDNGNRIVTVNIAGGHLRQLTDPAMDAQIPNWSPDGRRIVFQALGNIWAVESDGSDLTQLTFEPDSTPDFAPSYSPDGTKIIFHHASADGQRDLYTMNADGTGIKQFTHTDASERWPQWAPAR
jgi:TolB protein